MLVKEYVWVRVACSSSLVEHLPLTWVPKLLWLATAWLHLTHVINIETLA